ncbi:hypothetical protein OAF54_01770 [bacterium]|nr:hypothetical protein [bacterium]
MINVLKLFTRGKKWGIVVQIECIEKVGDLLKSGKRYELVRESGAKAQFFVVIDETETERAFDKSKFKQVTRLDTRRKENNGNDLYKLAELIIDKVLVNVTTAKNKHRLSMFAIVPDNKENLTLSIAQLIESRGKI